MSTSPDTTPNPAPELVPETVSAPVPEVPEVPEYAVRLRQARLERGLEIADVASRMRLRRPLIEAMERGDLAALGAPVFVRGYIAGYAQLLGLPSELADEALPKVEAAAAAPELHTNQSMSQGRYLLDRYARRFVYVALTASIVVPVVLLAMRDDLPAPATLLQPAGQMASNGDSLDIEPIELAPDTRLVNPSSTRFDQPVMASLAPIYSSRNAQQQLMTPAPPAAPALMPEETPATDQAGVVTGEIPEQGLVLHMVGESWIEVLGNDGKRLAHGVLQAGEMRQFDPGKVKQVVLGNGSAVEVRMNGAQVDLNPYRKANVVRFAVSSDGSLKPSGG